MVGEGGIVEFKVITNLTISVSGRKYVSNQLNFPTVLMEKIIATNI